MQNRYMNGILGLICLWLFSMSYSAGPGQLVGAALTTAPGESGNFCAQAGCHGGGTFNQTTIIEVADLNGNIINEYSPGTDYDVSVEINAANGTPAGYGFQMVALLDSDNSGTDSWTSDLPSSVHQVRLLDRDYVEHDGPMTGSNRFTVRWTAPSTGSGAVSFYAAGNAVNLNGSPSGDSADTTNLTITEEVVSSSINLEDQFSISVFPNPVSDYLTISIEKQEIQNVSMYTLSGKQILDQKISTGENKINVSNFSKGIYVLQLSNNSFSKRITRKIIIQ